MALAMNSGVTGSLKVGGHSEIADLFVKLWTFFGNDW